MSKDSHTSQTVGKLEAAERQLREAIRMFFECRNVVAIHTLVAVTSTDPGFVSNTSITRPAPSGEAREWLEVRGGQLPVFRLSCTFSGLIQG